MKKAAVFLSFLFLLTSVTHGANRFIPFQARLTDGDGLPLNGVYKLIFNIYDVPTGHDSMWVEEHEDVSVINGMVNVILGTKTNLDDPDGTGTKQPIYFTNNRYLGITVGTNSNQEMVPRHQLVPSFQARIADRAFEADNAARLNNELPDYYATKASVDDLSNRLFAAVPPGTVLTYAGSTIPAGFFECDGQEYSKSTYPELYSAIGDTYGATTTNFKVPDYRGYFLRGWDHGAGNDPEAADRTDSGNGTIGNNVGTKQLDVFKIHSHSTTVGDDTPDHSHGISYHSSYTHSSGPYLQETGNPAQSRQIQSNGASQRHKHSVTIHDSGGTETRPKNITVMYIIKY